MHGLRIDTLTANIIFQNRTNGRIITDSNYLSKIRIYYYENGYEIDDRNAIDPGNLTIHDEHTLTSLRDSGLFTSYFIPEISAEKHQYCYFEFPGGSIDTLWLNAEKVTDEEDSRESCGCNTPIRAIKFNQRIPEKLKDNKKYIKLLYF